MAVEGYYPIAILLLIAVGMASCACSGFPPSWHRSGSMLKSSRPMSAACPRSATPRERFNIWFYIIGMEFIIFDVEIAFLYPWAVAFKEMKGVCLPGHGDLPGYHRPESGVCLEAWSPAMGVETELRERMEAIAARFPQRLSAIIPILYLVQQQHGYVTKEGMELAAEVLGTTPAYVDSVASFYTMLYRQPVGKYVLQVCRTLAMCPHGS